MGGGPGGAGEVFEMKQPEKSALKNARALSLYSLKSRMEGSEVLLLGGAHGCARAGAEGRGSADLRPVDPLHGFG